MSSLSILAAAIIVDRFAGEPDWLWKRLPHPVVVIGRMIDWADTRFNREVDSDTEREKYGFAVIGVLIIGAVVTGRLLEAIFGLLGVVGLVAHVALVAILLAQKSLIDHVGAVAAGLQRRGLDGGREAVAHIVGRDPATLDIAGVSRAAIESLAENSSDGVIAPAFWYAVFGLPGIVAYKVINTADSMIGHRTDRHGAFGRAAAQIDDLANWVPARITALLILLAGGTSAFTRRARLVLTDAKYHRSPNAGWPECAMATVTGLALGGPRTYTGESVSEPFMNANGRMAARANDIATALAVNDRAMLLGFGAIVFLIVLS